MSKPERCPECHRPGWKACNFEGCPGVPHAAPTPPASAEAWLRERHGAYRGIPHWRELEEAYNAGHAAAPTPPADVAGLVEQLQAAATVEGGVLYARAADALASLSAVERANAELNSEVTRLYACRNELQEVTRAIDDPRVNNTITLDDAVRQLMQENTRLAAERDRYHDALIARHGGEPIALLAELDEARAERDANARDAARYRWLREESKKRPDFYSGDERWMVSRAQGGMGQNFFGEDLNVAIDAALARAKEGS